MKKKFSLFKSLYANTKMKEEAMTLMYSSFYKILKLDLKKNCYDEILVSSNEKHADKGYSHNFSEWAQKFAMTGNVYKDDIEKYLAFMDINQIKTLFKNELKKYTIKYRRDINGIMRWVSLDLIPTENFSEKNQTVYLYVYDIHDSLSKELDDTQFLSMVSKAITRSYMVCVYIDLEISRGRLIFANDYVSEFLSSNFNDSIPAQTILDAAVKNFSDAAYSSRLKEFCNLKTIEERLKNKQLISMEYLGFRGNICRANFVPVHYNPDGSLKSVIYSNRLVDGEIINLRGQLETEKALVKCLTALSGSEDFDEANKKILQTIGEFYSSASAFIYQIDFKNNLAIREFQWSNESKDKNRIELEEIKLGNVSHWLELFNSTQIVYISDREKELEHSSDEYKLLKKLNITSIMIAPFYDSNNEVAGFMGVKEPEKNINSDIVIRSANTFIIEEKLKQDYTEKLYKMSYSDTMTDTYNRAAYIRDMKEITEKNKTDTGILYADVNGLKDTNDTQGHEAGDVLIKSAVALLKKYFSRKKDRVYRIGGDEFVVISSDVSEKEFHTVVANLKDYLKSKWILSCGGAWFNRVTDIDAGTKEAEKAMYKNKSDYYATNGRADRRR